MQAMIRAPKQLGEVLRRYRHSRSLTQNEIAERTGLRQATVSSVEAGAPGTRIDTIFDLLTALDLELVVRPRTRASPAGIERIF